MSTRTIFDVLFTTKKSKTYQQAVDSLSRVRDIVSSVSIEYPDVSSKDISIIQNKWVSLDEPVGNSIRWRSTRFNNRNNIKEGRCICNTKRSGTSSSNKVKRMLHVCNV